MTIDVSNNNPRIEYSVAEGVTQTVFSVPFDYFEDSDVTIYVDGVAKVLGTDYTMTGGDGSTGTITFVTATPPEVQQVTGASGGSTVVVVRHVALERVTDFVAGQDINRAALNTQLDTIVAQIADLDDKVDRTLHITDYEVNPGTALPSIDARKGRVIAFNSSNGAIEAGPLSNDIQVIADNIAEILDVNDQAAAAAASATAAASSASSAASSETSASSSALSASASAATATTKAAEASTSATNAATSATAAQAAQTAVEAAEAVVAADAASAASSASTASTSASNAATSETNAASSASAAASSATAAAASESAAATSATNAATSETNAATSASTASTAATTATTQASSAATSATAAAASATAAAASEAGVAADAAAAAASASAAATSETNAASSATSAASSATTASTAASTAANDAISLIESLSYLQDFGLITDAAGTTADYGSIAA